MTRPHLLSLPGPYKPVEFPHSASIHADQVVGELIEDGLVAHSATAGEEAFFGVKDRHEANHVLLVQNAIVAVVA